MPERLRRFRQKHGISQTKMAEKLGIDQRQWSRYENGTNELPLRYLERICEKFNTTPNEILEYDDR